MKKILVNIIYVALKALTRFLMFLFFRVHAQGKENIPKDESFIIVANHSSYLDPVAVHMVFRKNISWITKKEIYDIKALKFIHYLCRTIKVNGAIDAAIDAINEGRIVGVFPEGGRSKDGSLRDGDVGAAIMALKTGMSILPIGIKGAYQAFGTGMKFPKPHPITINIGKIFSFEKVGKEEIEDSVLQDKKQYIMQRIEELL